MIYRVKEGRLDMSPIGFPWLEFPRFSFNWRRAHSFSIEWDAIDDYDGLHHGGDWMKAGGVTHEVYRNNYDAVLLAVRCEDGQWQASIYGNVDGGIVFPKSWLSSRSVMMKGVAVKHGWHVELTCRVTGDTIVDYISLGRPPRLVKSVGNYFGGDVPAAKDLRWGQSFKFS